MALTIAIEDIFKSIYELLASIIGTAYQIIHSTVSAGFSFIAGLFNLLGDFASGMAKAAGGVGKFVAGNIVLITIGALGAFAYVRYTAQGRRLADGKKTQPRFNLTVDSIGRDIIRGIDIDQNYKRGLDTAAIARSPEPKITETIPSPKEALPNEADPAELSATRDIVIDLDEAEIDSFETHRVDQANATVDILVKWGNGKQSWEPEWSLQQQVPVLIYKYWDTVGGRDAATGLDVYHVFRVLEQTALPRTKDFRYRVQWVGYRHSESTWEYESKLAQIAPEELIKFEVKNESAPEAPTRKPKRGIAQDITQES
ncbi:hypothetical protein B0T10DRAFT_610630 [Thelonectria olida]|uniref:Chromo domain-containing protein n=1 Tax=Thelonectria olida TaxID=1576542 RepID=A0A9P8VSS2_9HYPO|nr:hypothetical protein B0T10DRAFT_610630 [Thelonectria olida]